MDKVTNPSKSAPVPVEQAEIIKIKIKGKAFPKAAVVMDACMSYFDLYRTGEDVDKLGIIDFTQEGLNKISDAGMFNAIGITRQKWASWKNSPDSAKERAQLRQAIQYIEQILEQIDQQRLSSRGNVGDVFRMKARHNWRDKDGIDSKNSLTDLSSDKTAEILSRMSKK